jgi:hypothetical protein
MMRTLSLFELLLAVLVGSSSFTMGVLLLVLVVIDIVIAHCRTNILGSGDAKETCDFNFGSGRGR